MRHGFEWWEAFWKYLLEECGEEDFMEAHYWLKKKKKEFEQIWKSIPHNSP